jgi:Protein phosphatase 2C
MQAAANSQAIHDLCQRASIKPVIQETDLAIPETLYIYSQTKRADWGNQDRLALSFLNQPITKEAIFAAYQAAAEATLAEEGGCSATSLLLTEKGIDVAWLGDSPAFLVGLDSTGRIQEIIGVNEPHIPTYEREAIAARGGRVNEEGRLDLSAEASDQVNNYSLSMLRAFGNRWLGNLLIREPGYIYVDTTKLTPTLTWYAVIGSDGILPESERNLMHPRQANATPADLDLITYCADCFKRLVNADGLPWLAASGNWAENVAQIAQARLRQMEAVADKTEVGYAAVDDTTVMIIALAQDFSQTPTIALTIADGHRAGGEVTAQKAVEAIHLSLSGLNA